MPTREGRRRSAVVEQVQENHHPINWKETSVLDRARGQLHGSASTGTEGWRTRNPGLQELTDEETGRERHWSPTFDLQ